MSRKIEINGVTVNINIHGDIYINTMNGVTCGDHRSYKNGDYSYKEKPVRSINNTAAGTIKEELAQNYNWVNSSEEVIRNKVYEHLDEFVDMFIYGESPYFHKERISDNICNFADIIEEAVKEVILENVFQNYSPTKKYLSFKCSDTSDRIKTVVSRINVWKSEKLISFVGTLVGDYHRQGYGYIPEYALADAVSCMHLTMREINSPEIFMGIFTTNLMKMRLVTQSRKNGLLRLISRKDFSRVFKKENIFRCNSDIIAIDIERYLNSRGWKLCDDELDVLHASLKEQEVMEFLEMTHAQYMLI